MSLSILLLFAFAAGVIDAVVGGGGLIQIPALFAVLPGESPATLFGTNKCASVLGTANAGWRYARRVNMPWRTILPAAIAAFVFSYLGAAAVAGLDKVAVRPLIFLLLLGAAWHTFRHKDFGLLHRPAHNGRGEFFWAAWVGAGIGFYDGFFGPGTGSFLIFLFVRFFGFDFLHASAAAKLINVATNLSALSYFVPNAYFLPLLAVGMGAANVGGSMLGTQFALRHGSAFVRSAFLWVVAGLLLKFAWDTFRALY